MKNGGKNKNVALIILFNVRIIVLCITDYNQLTLFPTQIVIQ